jgi:hypothetical protein
MKKSERIRRILSRRAKPCPFCGAIPRHELFGGEINIKCNDNECRMVGVLTGFSETIKRALAIWNKRSN